MPIVQFGSSGPANRALGVVTCQEIRHAAYVGRDDWREIISHDGYLRVWLRLFTVGEGGQNRHLQSGFRALWTADGIPHPMTGAIEFDDEFLRCVRPGSEAMIRVRPLQPGEWTDVEPGMTLRLCRNLPRALGEGHVVERVKVPRSFVPLRRPDPPAHNTSVMLRRNPTLADRVRALMSRRLLRGPVVQRQPTRRRTESDRER